MRRLEEERSKHHENCYGRSQFKWSWGIITHPGIWAFGGDDMHIRPRFQGATWYVPAMDQEPVWCCYVGPLPEFEEHGHDEERQGQL